MTPASLDPWAELRRDYDGDLKTLHKARRDVVQWLADQDADEPTMDRAALIVSELSSNAIQNSPGLSYTVQVVRLDDEHAAISVTNRPVDRLPPPREQWRPPAKLTLKQLSLRGRGLAIVDSLSEELTIERLGEDLVVTARIRIVKKS
jgi:anti-sigma regulatory factor (Ser/Thr protein kinase)